MMTYMQAAESLSYVATDQNVFCIVGFLLNFMGIFIFYFFNLGLEP